MLKSTIYLCLAVIVGAKINDNSESHSEEDNCPRFCVGTEYECIDGYCYCAAGYIPNLTHNRCIRCPGLGQRCYGRCCDTTNGNLTLTCWKGFCTICQADEEKNTWICPDPYDNIFLISSTEIAMGSALVLGIIATFLLLYKLCSAVKNLRPLGSSAPSRPSIGSLQLYVDERLRDAPPSQLPYCAFVARRYSRTAPSMPTILAPVTSYMNAGFVHDNSVPPPPYTANKDDDHHNTTNYI